MIVLRTSPEKMKKTVGFIEEFNSRLPAECPDVAVFHNLADTRIKIAFYIRWCDTEQKSKKCYVSIFENSVARI